jgi:hypothetical protein
MVNSTKAKGKHINMMRKESDAEFFARQVKNVDEFFASQASEDEKLQLAIEVALDVRDRARMAERDSIGMGFVCGVVCTAIFFAILLFVGVL